MEYPWRQFGSGLWRCDLGVRLVTHFVRNYESVEIIASVNYMSTYFNEDSICFRRIFVALRTKSMPG